MYATAQISRYASASENRVTLYEETKRGVFEKEISRRQSRRIQLFCIDQPLARGGCIYQK